MSTMKPLTLVTIAAFSIGTGAAIAQEADAQFLPKSMIPAPTYQWLPTEPGSYAANPSATRAGESASPITTMFGQSHHVDVLLKPAPDGADGSGS
jgi:hypothetical protein